MNSFEVIKLLYIFSCTAMMLFIVKNKDSILISHAMLHDKKDNVSFVASMMVMIIFSPVVWLQFLADKNKK